MNTIDKRNILIQGEVYKSLGKYKHITSGQQVWILDDGIKVKNQVNGKVTTHNLVINYLGKKWID